MLIFLVLSVESKNRYKKTFKSAFKLPFLYLSLIIFSKNLISESVDKNASKVDSRDVLFKEDVFNKSSAKIAKTTSSLYESLDLNVDYDEFITKIFKKRIKYKEYTPVYDKVYIDPYSIEYDLSSLKFKSDKINIKDIELLQPRVEYLVPDFAQKYLLERYRNEEVLILQIIMGKDLSLNDGIVGYKSDDEIYVSLVEFSKSLEFNIIADESGLGATGWFIQESNLFTLNIKDNILLIGGKRYDFTSYDIKVIDNDIYISLEFLEKIFPIIIRFDERDLTINIKSTSKLPIEENLERENKWEDLNHQKDLMYKEINEDINIQTVGKEYKKISSPIVDLRYQYRYQNQDVATNNSSLSALISADVLYMNHQLFLNFEDEKMSNTRIVSTKRDPESGLLGPLNATNFVVGDIFDEQTNLVSRGRIGRGIMLSSYPSEYVYGFDNTVIRGNMQPGWDVEIYRNDYLLGFQKIDQTGLYEFTNVPLVGGQNIIRLKFYGPFGQKKEEIRRFYVDQHLIKKGKFYYRVMTNEQDRTIFKPDNTTNIDNAAYGDRRYFAEVTYGALDNMSLILNYSKIPILDGNDVSESHDYLAAGLRYSFAGIYTDVNLTKDLLTSKKGLYTSLQTNLMGYNILVRNSFFDQDYTSEQIQKTTDPLRNLSNVRVDGVLLPMVTNRISNSLDMTIFEYGYVSKKKRIDLQDDITVMVNDRITLGQNIRFMEDERSENSENLTGRFMLNYRIVNPVLIRTVLNYDIKPVEKLTSASSNIDWNITNTFLLNFSNIYNFPSRQAAILNDGLGEVTTTASTIGKSSSIYNVSFNKIFPNLIATIGVSYNTYQKAYGGNFNLSTSVGYDFKTGKSIASGNPMAINSIILAKIFIDKNNNNKFDIGDEPVKGVRIFVDKIPSKNKTDKNGFVMVGQINPAVPVKVSIRTDDIEDPSLIVKKEVYKVVTHSGSITDISFPLSPSGSVEGYVVTIKDGKKIDLSNVTMELLDPSGYIIKRTISSYDGFYSFESVPYGSYKIRISEAQLDRVGYNNKEAKIFEINSENKNNKINFNISEKPSKIGDNEKDIEPLNMDNLNENKNVVNKDFMIEEEGANDSSFDEELGENIAKDPIIENFELNKEIEKLNNLTNVSAISVGEVKLNEKAIEGSKGEESKKDGFGKNGEVKKYDDLSNSTQSIEEKDKSIISNSKISKDSNKKSNSKPKDSKFTSKKKSKNLKIDSKNKAKSKKNNKKIKNKSKTSKKSKENPKKTKNTIKSSKNPKKNSKKS